MLQLAVSEQCFSSRRKPHESHLSVRVFYAPESQTVLGAIWVRMLNATYLDASSPLYVTSFNFALASAVPGRNRSNAKSASIVIWVSAIVSLGDEAALSRCGSWVLKKSVNRSLSRHAVRTTWTYRRWKGCGVS